MQAVQVVQAVQAVQLLLRRSLTGCDRRADPMQPSERRAQPCVPPCRRSPATRPKPHLFREDLRKIVPAPEWPCRAVAVVKAAAFSSDRWTHYFDFFFPCILTLALFYVIAFQAHVSRTSLVGQRQRKK